MEGEMDLDVVFTLIAVRYTVTPVVRHIRLYNTKTQCICVMCKQLIPLSQQEMGIGTHYNAELYLKKKKIIGLALRHFKQNRTSAKGKSQKYEGSEPIVEVKYPQLFISRTQIRLMQDTTIRTRDPKFACQRPAVRPSVNE